jgi:hypothetical protein
MLETNTAEDQKNYDLEVDTLTQKLHEREAEIIDLQKKIIDLYEIRK